MKEALIELIRSIDDEWIIEYLYKYAILRFNLRH